MSQGNKLDYAPTNEIVQVFPLSDMFNNYVVMLLNGKHKDK